MGFDQHDRNILEQLCQSSIWHLPCNFWQKGLIEKLLENWSWDEFVTVMCVEVVSFKTSQQWPAQNSSWHVQIKLPKHQQKDILLAIEAHHLQSCWLFFSRPQGSPLFMRPRQFDSRRYYKSTQHKETSCDTRNIVGHNAFCLKNHALNPTPWSFNKGDFWLQLKHPFIQKQSHHTPPFPNYLEQTSESLAQRLAMFHCPTLYNQSSLLGGEGWWVDANDMEVWLGRSSWQHCEFREQTIRWTSWTLGDSMRILSQTSVFCHSETINVSYIKCIIIMHTVLWLYMAT